ncbi:MAG TPA: hypothetical protein VFF73_15235, partial [Planctomycetota bacterium]|nr:hypothetical protein [Planctomycetota bacterium]
MEIRCAYCHADAGRSPVECSRCKTLLHEDCFDILGKCPTLGCGALPPAERIRWVPLLVLALLLLGAVAFAVNLV